MIRFLDVVFALIAILLLTPILLLVSIVLRFTGEGKVFYVQERVGQNQKRFGLFKFATMLQNSPNMGSGTITLRNDPRVLPIGRILRKTKINELPQLLNVVIGDMSIIGPRPLTENHFAHYPPELRRIIATIKPGLSGLGSIVFRDEELLLSDKNDPKHYYRVEIAPYKASLEAWFVENCSVRLYFKCIFLTIRVVIDPSPSIALNYFHNLPQPKGRLQSDLATLKWL